MPQQSVTVDAELDRMIRQLGNSSTKIALLSVSAPTMPGASLQATVRAVADRTQMTGLLAPGIVGVVGIGGFADTRHENLEDQFIPRVRSLLEQYCEETGFGRVVVSFRSAARPARELRDAEDLLQILFDRPARSFVVGAPQPAFPGLLPAYRITARL